MARRLDRRRERARSAPVPPPRTGPAAPHPAPTPRPRTEALPRHRPPAAIGALPAFAPDPRLEAIARHTWILPAALAVGLVLRIAHLVWLRGSPFFSSLLLDARHYDNWAQRIVAGAWIDRAAFWVDPLYAYILAAIYGIGGHDLLLPRLVNIACGIATAAIVWLIAERVWASRFAAVVAAVMMVGFIPAIHFEGQIEKTALTVLLLATAVWLFLIGTWRAIAGAGLVLGLATLARGNALVFVPLAAAALALGWDRDAGDSPAAARPRRLQRAALLLATAVPVIALATVHNYLASGEFVPTTTNLGINLYLGNHAGNEYGYYHPPSFLHPNTESEVPDFRAEAARRTGQQLSDRALSDYWTGQTLSTVLADPVPALVRTVRKFQLTVNDHEVPDSEGVDLVAGWSPVLRVPVFWFGQLLCLAVLGAVVGRRRRGVRILVAVAIAYIASLMPFFVMARLRVQLVPLLAVLAGGAVAWLVSMARARLVRPLGYAGGILAAGALLAFYVPDWMAQRRVASLAIEWHNLGVAFASQGRTDDAIRAYEHAVATDATAVPAALRQLGTIYQRRGDYLRAEAAMRRVIELRPSSASGREALRKLYDAMLADARWRDDAGVRRRRDALGAAPLAAGAPAASADPVRGAATRARSLQAAGKYDEAIAVLQEAVRKGPYDEGLHYMLGQLMEQRATPEALVAFFSEEVARDEKPQTSHYYWAVGLARGGDLPGAYDHLRTALEIDPAHEMSQRQWGLLLEQQGKLDAAYEHVVEATRIHPEFTGALQDAARIADQLGRKSEAEDFRRRAASADPSSDRQFIYWARYLHAHGRSQAALPEVDRLLAKRPNDPEGLRLRDEIRASLGLPAVAAPAAGGAAAGGAAAGGDSGWQVSSAARPALVSALLTQPAGTPTWIVYDGRYPAAEQLARQIAAGFEEAKWTAQVEKATFSLRPGLFVFAADDPAPPAAATAFEGIRATQLNPTLGTGYRAFVEERKRTNPDWRGLELRPDQDYVIVVGRQP
jgi:tetratricopeptide (TPR) repeat protein